MKFPPATFGEKAAAAAAISMLSATVAATTACKHSGARQMAVLESSDYARSGGDDDKKVIMRFEVPPGAPSAEAVVKALDILDAALPQTLIALNTDPNPSGLNDQSGMALTDESNTGAWSEATHTVGEALEQLRAQIPSGQWAAIDAAAKVLLAMPAGAAGGKSGLSLAEPSADEEIAKLQLIRQNVAVLKAQAKEMINKVQCVKVDATAPGDYGLKTFNGSKVYGISQSGHAMTYAACLTAAQNVRNGLACAYWGISQYSGIYRLNGRGQVGGNDDGYSFDTFNPMGCPTAVLSSTAKYVCAGDGTDHNYIYDHTESGKGTKVSGDYGTNAAGCNRDALNK